MSDSFPYCEMVRTGVPQADGTGANIYQRLEGGQREEVAVKSIRLRNNFVANIGHTQ